MPNEYMPLLPFEQESGLRQRVLCRIPIRLFWDILQGTHVLDASVFGQDPQLVGAWWDGDTDTLIIKVAGPDLAATCEGDRYPFVYPYAVPVEEAAQITPQDNTGATVTNGDGYARVHLDGTRYRLIDPIPEGRPYQPQPEHVVMYGEVAPLTAEQAARTVLGVDAARLTPPPPQPVYAATWRTRRSRRATDDIAREEAGPE
jgi:hypothetical protein